MHRKGSLVFQKRVSPGTHMEGKGSCRCPSLTQYTTVDKPPLLPESVAGTVAGLGGKGRAWDTFIPPGKNGE